MARIAFTPAEPRTAAARLGNDAIHLWRIPYRAGERRAPLVALLAAYAGVAASAIRLGEAPHGKPYLEQPIARRPLEFNWSHSGDYALVALARDLAVGVDIERLGRPARMVEVAHRFFDPAEAHTLATLEPAARGAAFTGLWCAKEAVLKSAGEGLAFGLDRLAFAHADGALWHLDRIDPVLGEAAGWQLTGFAAAPDYRGAIAWRGAAREIRGFTPF